MFIKHIQPASDRQSLLDSFGQPVVIVSLLHVSFKNQASLC